MFVMTATFGLILESNNFIDTIRDILVEPKSNLELSTKACEIIMNISKSENILSSFNLQR